MVLYGIRRRRLQGFRRQPLDRRRQPACL